MCSKHIHTYWNPQHHKGHHNITQSYMKHDKCKQMSNFWQANGSFDFHIFMNGIYISLGYTVAGFTSVQDSAQHVLRSSSFWETAPLVIIPAAFSLTAQLECTHWLPSHGQITSNHLSPPWLAKWELMPEFDCFSFLYNPRFNNMPPSGGPSSTLEWDLAVQGHPEQHIPARLWLSWHAPLRSPWMVTFCRLKRYQKISR